MADQNSPRRDRPVTSQDVGRAAGVSQAAVSRVFTPGRSVSKRMREKVTKAAEQLGYQPNALARSLAGGRSYLIAIVVVEVGRSFFGQILEQLVSNLQKHALRAMVVTVSDDHEPRTTLREIMSYGIDGVIVATATKRSSLAFADGALRQNMPVVLINQETSDSLASAVCCDDREGAELAAELLASAGSRRMAYLAGPPETATSHKRLVGFQAALQERRLPEPVVYPGDYSYASGFRTAKAILGDEARPDGIFCGNDVMGLGLIDGLRGSPIKVGTHLLLVGFDGIEAGGWAGYDLATVEQPLTEMAQCVTALLLERIDNPRLPGRNISLSPRPRRRGSCQPPGTEPFAATSLTR